MNKSPQPVLYTFSGKKVATHFDVSFDAIPLLATAQHIVYVTDKNVHRLHRRKFPKALTIVIEAGEKHKNFKTVTEIIAKLIELKADRQTLVVGVGGGVVTDIAGFAASVFMRGIKFAFVPTSILAMVDASVGGKNGIDFGVYKNLVGIIRHPEFLVYDFSFLETLPTAEWENGFAEIIKHAAIKDYEMFGLLENSSLKEFRNGKLSIAGLVRRNVDLKYSVVANDEFETGDRAVLNFGHTIGHAIENLLKLPHGHAISIGMVLAAKISAMVAGLPREDVSRLTQLLKKYKLPVKKSFNGEKAWQTLLHDKKIARENIGFIVLHSLGKAAVHSLATDKLHGLYKSVIN